jgi:hypothetical protein
MQYLYITNQIMEVMKKIKILLITVILLSGGAAFQQVTAQEKSRVELDKEAKLQQAIDEQKKAMLLQKKAQEDAAQTFKDQQILIQRNLRDLHIDTEALGKEGDLLRIYGRGRSRSSSGNDPFMYIQPGGDQFYNFTYGGDAERTTWDFSKSVKENTFTSDYNFGVEKTVKSVIMSVMGDCKSGEIRIKIIMPGGKSYSDILIDESGNLNWRKSFKISETENQDKTGEWKFQITSNKATGFFKISLQTF